MIRRRFEIQRRLKDTIAPHALFDDTIAIFHVAFAFWCIVAVHFASVVATKPVDITPRQFGYVSSLLYLVIRVWLLIVRSLFRNTSRRLRCTRSSRNGSARN
jgi:uncharacterized membrane protein